MAGDPLASLTILNVPVAAPAEAGANTTVTVMASEGDKLVGEPEVVKPFPVATICVMLTVEFPVLVMVTF